MSPRHLFRRTVGRIGRIVAAFCQTVPQQAQKFAALRNKLAFGDPAGLQAAGVLLQVDPFGKDSLFVASNQFGYGANVAGRHFALKVQR